MAETLKFKRGVLKQYCLDIFGNNDDGVKAYKLFNTIRWGESKNGRHYRTSKATKKVQFIKNLLDICDKNYILKAIDIWNEYVSDGVIDNFSNHDIRYFKGICLGLKNKEYGKDVNDKIKSDQNTKISHPIFLRSEYHDSLNYTFYIYECDICGYELQKGKNVKQCKCGAEIKWEE